MLVPILPTTGVTNVNQFKVLEIKGLQPMVVFGNEKESLPVAVFARAIDAAMFADKLNKKINATVASFTDDWVARF